MDKIYVGKGTSKFDVKLIEINVCLSTLPKEHIFEYEGKKYIKLKVQEMKQPDKFGKTHVVEVNTWKPDKEKPAKNEFEDVRDLPF
ncbi:hypothetical protein [Massilibacteroides sp.]|uniref:hypothetical protein n=1 Tax=Massilibacteroides sp. TaxID=2034766 RepID=UPI002619B213|nr:hypothetical protein [Massilibacteroides sp.]MDD4515665.1 hypothetical protein [Massilibacteroides sp.]